MFQWCTVFIADASSPFSVHMQLLSSAYDAKKKSLSGHETTNVLDSLEQKLKHYEQSTFGMKEYIETKMRETDFQGM